MVKLYMGTSRKQHLTLNRYELVVITLHFLNHFKRRNKCVYAGFSSTRLMLIQLASHSCISEFVFFRLIIGTDGRPA